MAKFANVVCERPLRIRIDDKFLRYLYKYVLKSLQFFMVIGTPHVWLDINNVPIDNTYCEPARQTEKYLSVKRLELYSKTDPTATNIRLYVGEDKPSTGEPKTNHNLKLFSIFSKSEEMVEKNVLFSMQTQCRLNPGIRLYVRAHHIFSRIL